MKCINCNSTLLCRNKLFVLRHHCFAKKNSTPEKFPMPFAVRYANPLVFRHIKKTLSRIIGIRFFYFCRFNFPSKLFCFNSFFSPYNGGKNPQNRLSLPPTAILCRSVPFCPRPPPHIPPLFRTWVCLHPHSRMRAKGLVRKRNGTRAPPSGAVPPPKALRFLPTAPMRAWERNILRSRPPVRFRRGGSLF